MPVHNALPVRICLGGRRHVPRYDLDMPAPARTSAAPSAISETRSAIRAALVAIACAVALTACTGDEQEPSPEPVPLAWQEITLPAPPQGTRAVLGGGAACDGSDGEWYLVGGYQRIGGSADEEWLGTDDSMDPAAWISTDGATATELAVAAHSYYGIRSLLWGAACRDGTVVALGGKVGGAHGNPRMATYFPVTAPDGTVVLTEVDARFELYGGPNASNVGRMTAGPPGYLIVGNRSTGAAVWHSATGETFEIVEGAPVLSDSPERATWAADAEFYDGAWVVVGSVVRNGRSDRDPAAWRSSDGRTFTAIPTPDEPGDDALNVVATVGGSLTALGTGSDAFQAWRLGPGGWERAGRFGSTAVQPLDGRYTSALPVGLASAGDRLVAMVKAGWTYELWISADSGLSWRPISLPIDLPAIGDARAAVVGAGDQILLIADDGQAAHAYVASVIDNGISR